MPFVLQQCWHNTCTASKQLFWKNAPLLSVVKSCYNLTILTVKSKLFSSIIFSISPNPPFCILHLNYVYLTTSILVSREEEILCNSSCPQADAIAQSSMQTPKGELLSSDLSFSISLPWKLQSISTSAVKRCSFVWKWKAYCQCSC